MAEFNAPGGTSCGDLLRSYTWGLDLAGSLTATGGVGALVQLTDHASSTSYFPTYDGNGNVASLLRAADGVVAAKYEYSPFGELVRCEGAYAKSNPFRFSTKFTDDESGLVYYGARYYSPSLGRFINRDPIAEAGGINLYGFCGNDGINGVDYRGFNPIVMEPFIVTGSTFGPIGTVVGGIVGAVVSFFSSPGGFFKGLFGSSASRGPAIPSKPVLKATFKTRPLITDSSRYIYQGDDLYLDLAGEVFEGGMMDPMVVAESRLPSWWMKALLKGVAATSPSLAMAASTVGQYKANVALGGNHFNALNMTLNPAYMAATGFTETWTGIGMDAHDLGQSLTGWGRARAFGKGVFGAVGTVTAATGATAAGASLVRGVAARGASLAAETAAPKAYSVAYRTRLAPESYPGASRAAHFQEANGNLLKAMEGDASFAKAMKDLGVNLERTPTGLAPRQSPANWTWHHAESLGEMQLVPRVQHTPGSAWWDILHPGGQGGYSIWGK